MKGSTQRKAGWMRLQIMAVQTHGSDSYIVLIRAWVIYKTRLVPCCSITTLSTGPSFHVLLCKNLSTHLLTLWILGPNAFYTPLCLPSWAWLFGKTLSWPMRWPSSQSPSITNLYWHKIQPPKA